MTTNKLQVWRLAEAMTVLYGFYTNAILAAAVGKNRQTVALTMKEYPSPAWLTDGHRHNCTPGFSPSILAQHSHRPSAPDFLRYTLMALDTTNSFKRAIDDELKRSTQKQK